MFVALVNCEWRGLELAIVDASAARVKPEGDESVRPRQRVIRGLAPIH